jgi:hypothetical protein
MGLNKNGHSSLQFYFETRRIFVITNKDNGNFGATMGGRGHPREFFLEMIPKNMQGIRI